MEAVTAAATAIYYLFKFARPRRRCLLAQPGTRKVLSPMKFALLPALLLWASAAVQALDCCISGTANDSAVCTDPSFPCLYVNTAMGTQSCVEGSTCSCVNDATSYGVSLANSDAQCAQVIPTWPSNPRKQA